MPSLMIDPYISPYTPYLRTPLYYLTWLTYYLTFLISPIFLTLVQLLTLFLNDLLPRLERYVESQVRYKLKNSLWAQKDWKRGGKPFRELTAKSKLGVSRERNGTITIDEATGWGISIWRWIMSFCGGSQSRGQGDSIQSRQPTNTSTPCRTILQLSQPNALKLERSSALIRQKSNRSPGSGQQQLEHAGRLGTKWNQSGEIVAYSPSLLRERQYKGIGGSGISRSLPWQASRETTNIHKPSHDNLNDFNDDHVDGGSVWSGKGWKAA